jgi:DNA-binding NarL/FixJ family response regulator
MNASPTTILLCDDAEPLRRLHHALFEHQDDFVVVGEVGDGRACIEAVLELQPDVVLLDLRMPRPDGLGAIPGIRAACDATRIVVCSSSRDHWNRVRALALGATDFVPKDVAPSELVARVRAAAASPATR